MVRGPMSVCPLSNYIFEKGESRRKHNTIPFLFSMTLPKFDPYDSRQLNSLGCQGFNSRTQRIFWFDEFWLAQNSTVELIEFWLAFSRNWLRNSMMSTSVRSSAFDFLSSCQASASLGWRFARFCRGVSRNLHLLSAVDKENRISLSFPPMCTCVVEYGYASTSLVSFVLWLFLPSAMRSFPVQN